MSSIYTPWIGVTRRLLEGILQQHINKERRMKRYELRKMKEDKVEDPTQKDVLQVIFIHVSKGLGKFSKLGVWCRSTKKIHQIIL